MADVTNLVKNTYPLNGTKNVSTQANILINFSEDMNVDTVTSKEIILKEVNGVVLTATYEYLRMQKQLKIKAVEPLKPDTKYQVTILSKEFGPISIIGTRLKDDKIIIFTTEQGEESLPKTPENVSVIENDGFIKATWTSTPQTVSLVVKDSTSDTAAIIWPEVEYQISSNNIEIPKKFPIGDYSFWIRSYVVKDEINIYSEYKKVPFQVKEKEIIPPEVFNLFITKSYPENKAMIEVLDKFALLFNEEVDVNALDESSIYITKFEKDEFISQILGEQIIDFVIKEKEETLIKSKMLTLIPEKTLFEKGGLYKIKASSQIHKFGDPFVSLGKNYEIVFRYKWAYYYATVESVRLWLGGFGNDFDDDVIESMIAEASAMMYNKFSKGANFNKEEWENGIVPYNVPLYISAWVAYRLILNQIVKSSSGHQKDIQLGDLSVGEKNMQSTELVDLLGLLKAELDKLEDTIDNEALSASFAKGSISIKGETGAPYPEYTTKNPFADWGN